MPRRQQQRCRLVPVATESATRSATKQGTGGRPDCRVDEELWARVAALEGRVLRTATQRFVVARVDDAGVSVRRHPTGGTRRLSRRMLAEALPFVAAGQPLPRRFGDHAARLTAILRAAGVGPEP
jgi:hypothetical protein